MDRRRFFKAVTGLGSAAALAPTALVAKPLTPDRTKALMRAWRDGYMSLNEIRYIERRKFEIEEMCAWFDVRPEWLGIDVEDIRREYAVMGEARRP